MYKQLQKHQAGAVSMITVIFVSIILTILTTSFIRLTINEQRESIDDDLTTRAYYAAESGVQDAIVAIKSGNPIKNPGVCKPESGKGVLSSSENLDTAYTCQTIDLTPTDYQASLSENETVFFKLDSGTSGDISSLKISWHIKGSSGDSDGSNIALRSGSSLPKSSNWSNSSGKSYPAMLRTQLIATPESNITRDLIENYVGFLNPRKNGVTSISKPSLMDGNIVSADCSTGVSDGDYVCSVSLNGLNDLTKDYYLRLQSLYRPTHVKIEAFTDAGLAVALVNAQAVIDVTGRAGDVYRRVEERVSLIPDDLWPNYAILSAEDLCKNFVITDEALPHPTKPDFADVNPGIDGSCAD